MKDGRKDDSGKPRYDLIPPHAELEVARVLTYGAELYGAWNWRLVPDARNRYTAALMRHVAAWRRGENLDSESGLHHLAHAAVNALFLLELDRAENIAETLGNQVLMHVEDGSREQTDPAFTGHSLTRGLLRTGSRRAAAELHRRDRGRPPKSDA